MSKAMDYLRMCQDGAADMAEHDRRFHGGKYDPETMSCGLREKQAKGDDSDAEVSTPKEGSEGKTGGSDGTQALKLSDEEFKELDELIGDYDKYYDDYVDNALSENGGDGGRTLWADAVEQEMYWADKCIENNDWQSLKENDWELTDGDTLYGIGKLIQKGLGQEGVDEEPGYYLKDLSREDYGLLSSAVEKAVLNARGGMKLLTVDIPNHTDRYEEGNDLREGVMTEYWADAKVKDKEADENAEPGNGEELEYETERDDLEPEEDAAGRDADLSILNKALAEYGLELRETFHDDSEFDSMPSADGSELDYRVREKREYGYKVSHPWKFKQFAKGFKGKFVEDASPPKKYLRMVGEDCRACEVK